MADHTGKKAKKPLDTSSIKMTTLMSFLIFALFLLAVLWGMSNFLLNGYYERARSQEVMRTAEVIESQFRQSPTPEDFDQFAIQTAGANGIYIRIDVPDGSLVYDGTRTVKDNGTFENDISSIRATLEASTQDSITQTRRDAATSTTRLVYASYIRTAGYNNLICIIAPLYPDEVTVRILRGMLIYVSIIVMGIAFLLAIALSMRIAGPIENLTQSARELSRGNYDVRFDGSSFTETKELAKALNKASYEMERADFYQREIIANVSHDLKTPLTMIRSYAEKIIDISGDNPEKRNSDLNIIIQETERLNRLVSDMLTVSNLQSNNVEMHMETFDLVEAAKEVYDSFSVLASSEGFDMQFHPCKPAYVVGDRTRITQVMNNFVSNAVKYSGDRKFVDIKLSKSGRKVAFHCIDHGMGIPSDEIGHVWDKYYRTSANHERGIEGTGLGLSIVKSLLTLHNANYGVESEEGKGSDFWFEMDTVKKPSAKAKGAKE